MQGLETAATSRKWPLLWPRASGRDRAVDAFRLPVAGRSGEPLAGATGPARLVIHMGDSGSTGLAAARYSGKSRRFKWSWPISGRLSSSRSRNAKADGEVLIAALRALSVRAPRKPAETLRHLPGLLSGCSVGSPPQPVQWISSRIAWGGSHFRYPLPLSTGHPYPRSLEKRSRRRSSAYLEHVTAHGWRCAGPLTPGFGVSPWSRISGALTKSCSRQGA